MLKFFIGIDIISAKQCLSINLSYFNKLKQCGIRRITDTPFYLPDITGCLSNLFCEFFLR